MRPGMVKAISLLLMIVLISGWSPRAASAQDPVRKLSRGVANMFTGVFEIPDNIGKAYKDESLVIALSYGLFKGIGMALLRTIAGVYETVTCAIPFPDNYVPLMEPEFLLSDRNFL